MNLILKIAFLYLGVLFLIGCDEAPSFKATPLSIIGQWKAESYNFDGLRLPISPDITIGEKTLNLIAGGEKQELLVSSIEVEGSDIIINIKNGIGFTFHLISENRMYFQVPGIGTRIYYQKQVELKTLSA